MTYRTDRNNNPAAFTTTLAAQAGLIPGTDYIQGESFTVSGVLYYTAKLLRDPIELTIKVIDAVGYYTKSGQQRWTYIAIPNFVWSTLLPEIKKAVIQFHYHHEGGTELENLWQA